MTVENFTEQERSDVSNAHRLRGILGLAALTATAATAATLLAPETVFAADPEAVSYLIHEHPIATGLASGTIGGFAYAATKAYFCKPSSRRDAMYYYSTCQRFEVIANTSIPVGAIVGLVVGSLWWLVQ